MKTRFWQTTQGGMKMRTFLAVVLAGAQTAIAAAAEPVSPVEDSNKELNGLYYFRTMEGGHSMKLADGSSIRLGKKSGITILGGRVYSVSNDNTNFVVSLITGKHQANSNTLIVFGPVALRVGDHVYAFAGGSGDPGRWEEMQFEVPDKDEARAAAKWLSVECTLRSNPGYRISAEFIPAKSEFQTNEPVMVKFMMKNVDARKITFERGIQHRSSRNNEFSFHAKLDDKPVPDVGDGEDFGEFVGMVDLEPGKAIEEQIDLKKWFAFGKPGIYAIHGSYGLPFFRRGDTDDKFMPWSVIWTDMVSADFEVVIK